MNIFRYIANIVLFGLTLLISSDFLLFAYISGIQKIIPCNLVSNREEFKKKSVYDFGRFLDLILLRRKIVNFNLYLTFREKLVVEGRVKYHTFVSSFKI